MKKFLSVGMMLVLYGCGGGGGGSDSSFHIFSDRPNVTVSGETIRNTFASIPMDSRGEPGKSVYLGAFSDSSAIESAQFNFTSETGGFWAVEFKPGYEVGDGETKHDIALAICYDANCNEHVSGSPINASVTYQVNLTESVALDASEIAGINYSKPQNAAGISDNLFTKQIVITGDYLDLLTYKVIGDDLVTDVEINHDVSTKYNVELDIRLPDSLDVKTHLGNASIEICYDTNCQFPISGSPIEFPVNYTVAPKEDRTYAGMLSNESLSVSHDVVEAGYIPGIDVLVAAGSRNVTVFNLGNNSSHTFDLDNFVGELSVDLVSKQGRIAVSNGFIVTVIDYDHITPENSIVKSFSASENGGELAVRRNDLFLTEYGSLVLIDTQNGMRSEQYQYYNLGSEVKINATGNALYALSDIYGEENIYKASIVGDEWKLSLVQDPNAGDYDFGDGLWFDKDGQYLFTGKGYYFHASNDASTDMTFAGQLPLQVINGNYGAQNVSLNSVVDTGESYLITENYSGDTDVASVRELRKSDFSEIAHFQKTERDGVTEHPFYAFKSDAGHLFALKSTSSLGSNRTDVSLVRLR